jgi:hypothetical protein
MKQMMMTAVIAAAAVALAGCSPARTLGVDLATTGPTALDYAMDAVKVAQGVTEGAGLALGAYRSLPACGEPTSGPMCQDLNLAHTTANVLKTLDDATADLAAGLAAFKSGNGSVDLPKLASAAIKAAFDVNAAVARFKAG